MCKQKLYTIVSGGIQHVETPQKDYSSRILSDTWKRWLTIEFLKGLGFSPSPPPAPRV